MRAPGVPAARRTRCGCARALLSYYGGARAPRSLAASPEAAAASRRSYYRERLELQRQDEEQAQRARTAFDACDGNRDGLLKQARRPSPK